MRIEDRVEIVVVEGDSSYRSTLTGILTSAGYRVCAFASASDFLDVWEHDGPACVLLDVNLRDVNGMEVYRRRLAGYRLVATIFLSAYADVSTSVAAMKSGAYDFLQKPVPRDRLLAVVDAAVADLEEDFEEARLVEESRRRYETLTPRETEVFELIVRGLLNKQIARRLGISVRTVKVHRSRLMAKMHVDRLPGLMAEASRLGLIDDAAGPDGPTAL